MLFKSTLSYVLAIALLIGPSLRSDAVQAKANSIAISTKKQNIPSTKRRSRAHRCVVIGSVVVAVAVAGYFSFVGYRHYRWQQIKKHGTPIDKHDRGEKFWVLLPSDYTPDFKSNSFHDENEDLSHYFRTMLKAREMAVENPGTSYYYKRPDGIDFVFANKAGGVRTVSYDFPWASSPQQVFSAERPIECVIGLAPAPSEQPHLRYTSSTISRPGINLELIPVSMPVSMPTEDSSYTAAELESWPNAVHVIAE